MTHAILGSETAAGAEPADPLRHLAELVRTDRAAFDFLDVRPELIPRIAAAEYRIGAAILREAARRADAGTSYVVGLVARLGDRIGLPETASAGPYAGDYLDALVTWYEAIQDTDHIARSWDAIARLLRVDFGSWRESRARFLSLLAEIGLGATLPRDIEAELLACVDRSYLFAFDARQFLSLLAFTIDRALRDGDRTILSGGRMIEWCRCLAASPYTRRRRKLGRRSLMVIKDEIHSRVARACRLSELLLGRFGGVRRSLVLLLIKLDHAVFASTGASTWRQSYPGYLALRWLLLRLVRSPAARARSRRLTILEPSSVNPAAGDILVMRAQGGLGDVMTMRPGLLELGRRRGCRVTFATDPAYFPAFSPDDPLSLLDINRPPLHAWAYDLCIDLTNCPAARVEVWELPRVRSNRIDIFAAALGVPDLDVGKLPPLRFDPAIEASADEILRRSAPSGRRTVGIQYRSAEAYKDVPSALDVARALAARHRVFVFYDRAIPRRADDRFIAIDDQPLPVALALASKLDVLVTPDSSLLHLAGINRIPCLGVFGPTDGTVRCAHYPTVEAFDLRASFACMPCWRNRFTDCRVTAGADSLCMRRITVSDIVTRVESILRATS